MQIATPSFIVTASGWAPPIPPSPAVTVMVPARVAEPSVVELVETPRRAASTSATAAKVS